MTGTHADKPPTHPPVELEEAFAPVYVHEGTYTRTPRSRPAQNSAPTPQGVGLHDLSGRVTFPSGTVGIGFVSSRFFFRICVLYAMTRASESERVAV